MNMSKAIPSLEEALRVIRALDDKSQHVRNQVNQLYSTLSEEQSEAFGVWEGLMEDIIISLQGAEIQRKTLVQSMEAYLTSLQRKN